MIRILWIFFLFSPAFLVSFFYKKYSKNLKFIFSILFYEIFYSNIGYLLQNLEVKISIINISIIVLLFDATLIYCLLSRDFLSKDILSIKINNYNNSILLFAIITISFILFYYNQSRYFQYIAPDSWYCLGAMNYIKDNGLFFFDNNILNWYPDGFHYLLGITFLPFSSTDSYALLKFIGPVFGVFTILGLYEIFKDEKKSFLVANFLYFLSMPYLINRFSMYVPEPIGLFFIVAIAAIIKNNKIDKKVITTIGGIAGLFTSTYHFIGPIIFITFGLVVLLDRSREIIIYMFTFFLCSFFFWLPYLIDISGFILYQQHIVSVEYYPQVWIDSIYASGIVLFAKAGVRESIIGFPLGTLFPLVLIKHRKKDPFLLYASSIMIFSLILGVSYLFYTNGLALRYKPIFAISCALLFIPFLKLLEEKSKILFKDKTSKFITLFLIILLLNRGLILIAQFPFVDPSVNIEESDVKMALWIDDNLINQSNIIVEKSVLERNSYFYENANTSYFSYLLYPRKVFYNESVKNENYQTFSLFYGNISNKYTIVHQEGNLSLLRVD